MKIAEKVLFVLVAISLTMKYALMESGTTLLLFALFFLATLYYLFTLGIVNSLSLKTMFRRASYAGQSTLRIVGIICMGIWMSVVMIGVLFKLLQWQGADNMLMIGADPLVIASAVALYKFAKSRHTVYRSVIVRVAPMSVVAILLLSVSNYTLVEFEFRNHPDYVRAWAASEAEPGNKELWNKREYEYYRAILSPEEFQKYQEQATQK